MGAAVVMACDRGVTLFHLVAIGASAGGLPALSAVLSRLPADFPLPIAIVQHIDPVHESLLADILGRCTHLRVREGADDDPLLPGTVYVAPPGWHMEVSAESGCSRIALEHSEPLHFVRPSADRLFESAAAACGPIIGVVLTGNGTDGAVGAEAIRRAGGVVIAQDEATSAFFGMPHAAIEHGAVDHVLPLKEIAPALLRLAKSDHV